MDSLKIVAVTVDNGRP